MFYNLECHGGEPTTRLLLEGPIGSAGASVLVAFGALVPERLGTLCGVTDDEARRLLQGSHESFKGAAGGTEKFRAHLFEKRGPQKSCWVEIVNEKKNDIVRDCYLTGC